VHALQALMVKFHIEMLSHTKFLLQSVDKSLSNTICVGFIVDFNGTKY